MEFVCQNTWEIWWYLLRSSLIHVCDDVNIHQKKCLIHSIRTDEERRYVDGFPIIYDLKRIADKHTHLSDTTGNHATSWTSLSEIYLAVKKVPEMLFPFGALITRWSFLKLMTNRKHPLVYHIRGRSLGTPMLTRTDSVHTLRKLPS